MIFSLMIVLLSCFAVAEVSSSITHEFSVSESINSGGSAQSDVKGFCSNEVLYMGLLIVILIVLSILFRKKLGKMFNRKKKGKKRKKGRK